MIQTKFLRIFFNSTSKCDTMVPCSGEKQGLDGRRADSDGAKCGPFRLTKRTNVRYAAELRRGSMNSDENANG